MFKTIPRYKTRFIAADQIGELVNLYHLARTALSGRPCGRYERMLWASAEFNRAHPEHTATAAYKDLEGLLA
jgi:hypothetical protein